MNRPVTPYIVAESGYASTSPIAVRKVVAPGGARVRLLDGGALGVPKFDLEVNTPTGIAVNRSLSFEPDFLPFLTDCYVEITDETWDGSPVMIFAG
jgi:hypothetical protein